jgi:hypothetical protein
MEMEGSKTTSRRGRQGGSQHATGAEPVKAPAKAPAKASAKAPAKASVNTGATAPTSASARPKVTKPKPVVRTDVETSLTESDRLRMIELAAFFRAERRGFVPGFEVEDWFAAEAEIAAQIPATPAAKPARKTRKPAS